VIVYKKGFILLTTVTMIAVLLTLVLSLQNSIYLEIKTSNVFIKAHQDFYKLEDLAEQISQNISGYATKDCVVAKLDMNEINKTLLISKGCRLEDKNHDHYYIVSDLGVYSCLQIGDKDIKYSSHHWLISLTSKELSSKIIQIRIALPIKISNCDLSESKIIQAGIISRRDW
jgi:hypothetical protein